MRKYFLTAFFSVFVTGFYACQSRQQTDSQLADSTAVTTPAAPSASVPISGRLADLGLTSSTDWRMVNVGDEFTHVKAVEKGEPFESDAEHIGYTVELRNLETADVLYYQTNGKVSAIDVDLFLNSQSSVTAYRDELNAYFTGRYGAPKPAGKGTVWTTPAGTVGMEDVSKGKDFGLKIRMAPLRTLTASIHR